MARRVLSAMMKRMAAKAANTRNGELRTPSAGATPVAKNHLGNAAEVMALRRLRETSERLWRSHDLRTGLEEMIDAGKALLGADFGNIQTLNPEKQVLEIVAQRGFGHDFLEYFREVSTEGSSACGRSLRKKERIIIEDVDADSEYGHRPAAAAAGYRAVQSTPLFGSDGSPLGMFSTHFRQPHRPSEEELARFDLYANQAAQFIERIRVEEQLKQLSGKLLSVQEAGNREIARELHDVFSQDLAAVSIELSLLEQELKADIKVAARIAALEGTIGKLSGDLHQTSRQLHPAIMEDLGLEPALRQECESFQQRTGIRTKFEAEEVPARIPQDVALCLYRTVQESLRNVQKHAKSSAVRVRLEGADAEIRLRVEDSGEGFDRDVATRKGGLGLISMGERVRLVNGKLTVVSQPRKGTTVTAIVPVEWNH